MMVESQTQSAIVTFNRARGERNEIEQRDAQSFRVVRSMPPLTAISTSTHAMQCIAQMLANEEELAGEWAVFYHCYAEAAALMEIQGAIAHVLWGYPSARGPLPRIRSESFVNLDTAADLLRAGLRSDHDSRFRAVAISTNTSLLSRGGEAAPIETFRRGYSVLPRDQFATLLDRLLADCGVEPSRRGAVAAELVGICTAAGLPDPAAPRRRTLRGGYELGSEPGAILQIFVHASAVDELAYASFAIGRLDASRMPLSASLSRSAPAPTPRPRQAVGARRPGGPALPVPSEPHFLRRPFVPPPPSEAAPRYMPPPPSAWPHFPMPGAAPHPSLPRYFPPPPPPPLLPGALPGSLTGARPLPNARRRLPIPQTRLPPGVPSWATARPRLPVPGVPGAPPHLPLPGAPRSSAWAAPPLPSFMPSQDGPPPESTQARVVCAPRRFLDGERVRVHAFAASPTAHEGRVRMARRLAEAVRRLVLPTEQARRAAAAVLVPDASVVPPEHAPALGWDRRVVVSHVRANDALRRPQRAG